MTYSNTEIATAIRDVLLADVDTLGLGGVVYGDQVLIPVSPLVCVEPLVTDRAYTGTNYRTDNTFQTNVIVYFTNLDNVEDRVRDCDLKTEEVADFLNAIARPEHLGGTRLGGLILQGHTTTIQYQYSMREKRLVRANQIVFVSQTRTDLVTP